MLQVEPAVDAIVAVSAAGDSKKQGCLTRHVMPSSKKHHIFS
jgi:hypothetical protein